MAVIANVQSRSILIYYIYIIHVDMLLIPTGLQGTQIQAFWCSQITLLWIPLEKLR